MSMFSLTQLGLKKFLLTTWSLGSYWETRQPSDLVLTVLSDTSIQLDWTNAASDFGGHSIERSDDYGLTYSEIDTVAAGTNTYNDTTLSSGSWVYYRVRAYQFNNYSPYSNIEDECTTIATILADGHIWSRYDFAVESSITKNGSDLVSDVKDLNNLAGNRNLHNLFSSDTPEWSAANGIHFANQSLATFQLDLAQPCTIYVVMRANEWVLNQYIFNDNNPGAAVGLFDSVETPFVRLQCEGAKSSMEVNLEVGRWVVMKMVANGASSAIQINKRYKDIGDFGAANPLGLSIGGTANGGSTVDSDYQEIIVRDNVSATDETAITNWLMKKHESKVAVTADVFPSTSIAHIGDSLTWFIDDFGLFNEYSDNYDAAVPGLGVNSIREEWNKMTFSLQKSFEYVFLMIGANDYLSTAAQFIALYQILVNTIKADAPQCHLVICTITPIRDNENWSEAAYAQWLLMNEAIRGEGATPITGADDVCFEHTNDLSDANDRLLVAYDNGDHLHLNEAGYTIVANRMKEFLV